MVFAEVGLGVGEGEEVVAVAVFGDLAEARGEGEGLLGTTDFFAGMGGEDVGEKVGGVEEFWRGCENGFTVGDGFGGLALFELKEDEAVAEGGVGGFERNGLSKVGEGEIGVAVFEGQEIGIFAEVGIFGMFGDGIVKDDEGFGELIGLRESGSEEAGDADVVGKEFAGFAERGDSFGGVPLLSEELSEEELVVGVVEFGAFDKGFGEGVAEVVDGEVGEGSLDKLIRGALRGGGCGVANPISAKGSGGGAAFEGSGRSEICVGDDLIGRNGAPVDGEEFAIGGNEETGRDRKGRPEVDDGGLEGVEEFDG